MAITSTDKPHAGSPKSPSPLWLRPLEFFLGPLNRRNLMVWVKLIALILVVRWIFIEPFRIPSGSMEPTLYGDGSFLTDDRVMVNKLAFGPRIPFTGQRIFDFGHPRRWEIVVFRSVEPPPPGSTAFQKAVWRLWPKVLIKRVVGMPGERIHIRDGVVYADGKALELPPSMPPVHYTSPGMEIFQPRPGQFVIDDGWRYGLRTEDEYALVPKGHYLVLGDNSGNSADGRRFGWLPEGHILGRAFGIWWPLSRRHDLTGFSHTWWGMLLLYGIPALLVLYELCVSFVSRSWPVHADLPRLGLIEGDRLRVNCRAFGWRLPFSRRRVTAGREPQTGEVVLYRAPHGSPWEGATLLGRVVAPESQKPGYVVEEAETDEGARDLIRREDLVGAVEAVWWPLRRRRPLGSTPPTTVADERA